MKPDAAFNRRVMRVFEDMLDQPPVNRDSWLNRTVSGEPAIRDAVRALADASRSSSLMPTSPPEPRTRDGDDAMPSRIGHYSIIRELGRGGMGVVYLGERDDGLFEHKVAIKVMRRTLLSERALARFATERRILARLRHPHIAQMLDGGLTPNGGSYIVMELIGGRPITDYCTERGLHLHARLALFREAGDAIEHAHRNLIVHADIKPSNVIVEDGFGVKLLDFGVARLLDEHEDGHEGYTPGYASPGRIEGLPATPADDIYAAGRLLGELCEGQAGIDGDLLAVIAMATATDPGSRYAAIGELLDDLDRWRTHRPTKAAPPDRRRRALLLWRRRRLALTTSAVAALALLIALTTITTLYLQSERRRALAEQRYAASLHMADYIIGSTDPALARVPGTLPLRKELVEQTGAYLRALETNRSSSPVLEREIAAGYLRMAQVYGLDPSGGIGDLTAAKASLRHAEELIDAAAAQAPDVPELLYLRGEAKLREGSGIFVEPGGAVARQSLVALIQAQGFFRRYLARVPGDTEAQLGLWGSEIMPERSHLYLGHPAAGLGIIEADLVKPPIPVSTIAQRKERDFYLNGSYLLLGEGYAPSQPKRALAYYDKLVDHVTQMQREGSSDWESDLTQTSGLAERSDVEAKLGDFAAAVRDNQKAVTSLAHLYLVEHNHMMGFYLNDIRAHLAELLAQMHRYREARQTSDAAISWLRSDVAAAPRDGSRLRVLGLVLAARASIEDRSGARAAACSAGRQFDDVWRSVNRLRAATPSDTAPSGPIPEAAQAVARDC